MASYLLLVNNRVIRDEKNRPILEIQRKNKVFYSNGKDATNQDERVEEAIRNIAIADSKNPLYEVVEGKSEITRYNHDLKIKMIISPLYELQQQLAADPKINRIAGFNLELQPLWREQRLDFYLFEFAKYAQIMDYLEQMVRASRASTSSPFTIRHKDHRVMNIVHVDVAGLFNPLKTVEGLGQYKLFRRMFGKVVQEEEIFSLDNPEVFPVQIMRGKVTAYFATSRDILRMCGIKFVDSLSSKHLYTLIAGICLRDMFPTMRSTSRLLLELPTNVTLYTVYNVNTGEGKNYFTATEASRELAAMGSNDYSIATTDANSRFISEAFPKYKKRQILATDELLREIGDARFV